MYIKTYFLNIFDTTLTHRTRNTPITFGLKVGMLSTPFLKPSGIDSYSTTTEMSNNKDGNISMKSMGKWMKLLIKVFKLLCLYSTNNTAKNIVDST